MKWLIYFIKIGLPHHCPKCSFTQTYKISRKEWTLHNHLPFTDDDDDKEKVEAAIINDAAAPPFIQLWLADKIVKNPDGPFHVKFGHLYRHD